MSSIPTRQADPAQPELEDIVARALERARDLGASQAEAGVSIDNGLSVTVRLGEVETIEYHRDRGLGITVYFGGRKGSASTADLDAAVVGETVDKACSIARQTAEDEFAGLADAHRMATDIPDLDLWHPWDLDPEAAIDLAGSCEEAAMACDERITNSEGASVNSHSGLRVYGNSHGFLGGYPSSSHSLGCAVLGQDEDGMQRDYWYTNARDAGELEPAEEVGKIAGERTVGRLGARKLTTRKAPVLFPAELARSLIGHFVSAVSGSSQYRRASFLLDAAGQEVFPGFVSLGEHPHLPRAMGSVAFDSEGVATRDRQLVANGVLQGYVLSSYSARKLGLETTGNAGGVHNLTLEGGDGDLAALLERMGAGLLLRELMGHGVNGVTGDYSRGAAGFWVEDGRVQYPVHEITIAGNLREMLAGIVAAGTDLDTRSSIRCGSLLLGEMTIAGD